MKQFFESMELDLESQNDQLHGMIAAEEARFKKLCTFLISSRGRVDDSRDLLGLEDHSGNAEVFYLMSSWLSWECGNNH